MSSCGLVTGYSCRRRGPAVDPENPWNQPLTIQGLYVALDGVDEHYERAVAEGAEIPRPLADTDYGSREYTASDLEGNLWSFGTYRPGKPVCRYRL